MQPTNIVRYSEGQNYYRRSSGFAAYGSMSLPLAEMAAFGEALAAVDLTPPRDAMLVTPLPAPMARLQRLHAAAGDLAERAPEIIANSDTSHGLEQALIEALVDCLTSREDCESSVAQGQHAILMRRFRRVVEENSEQPLYILEICKGIRVSDRTLRICCQERLGMGPKRYLLLRRLHLVHRALCDAAPETISVTEVATRYGFWQLGRFALEYQALFGEAPSATLRQIPG
jgi:AraC-like DNA-binding protein